MTTSTLPIKRLDVGDPRRFDSASYLGSHGRLRDVPRETDFARAFGEWLFERGWSHFVTLTTRYEMRAERLNREFRDGYVRRLAHLTQVPVTWALFVEFLRPRHHPHIHALLGATEHLSVRQLERAWQLGNTRIRTYEPSRGAAFYVCKRILETPDDWDISGRLPRHLRPQSHRRLHATTLILESGGRPNTASLSETSGAGAGGSF